MRYLIVLTLVLCSACISVGRPKVAPVVQKYDDSQLTIITAQNAYEIAQIRLYLMQQAGEDTSDLEALVERRKENLQKLYEAYSNG